MMKHRKRVAAHLERYVAVILIIFALSGCATVGPDYVRPEIPIPERWNNEGTGDFLSASGTDIKMIAEWWSMLDDHLLSSLIERAVKGNLDAKKAIARQREGRAHYGVAKSAIFPSYDFKGSTNWNYSRESGGAEKTSELYSASFDAGWELDIFGGIRRSIEASKADMEAVQEDLYDVLVSLSAEVALNYIEVRSLQSRIDAAEKIITILSETHQLTLWQHQAGLIDELGVQQSRYNLENAKSQIPVMRRQLEAAMNRIALLLGDQPGKVHEELKNAAPIPPPPMKAAVALPADLLRLRPDIRRAERELAAQTARVGKATADLYPKFSLSGDIGLNALSLNSLFSSAAKTASGGSLISLPIFRGGAIRQNIEVQSALQEQALIKYEATVLNALEEVENVLLAYVEEQKRRDSISEAEKAARKAVEIAQQKYNAGLTDLINVLDAQRSLLSFQDQFFQSSSVVTANFIKLCKALGRGWTSLVLQLKKE